MSLSSGEKVRREHALHNLNVCTHLYNNTSYYDWIVTTAFYTAVHFVEYKLFPLNDNSVTFRDFNHYYRQCGNGSKHGTKVSLCVKHLPKKISAKYQSLFSSCDTARYRDYRLSQLDADKAFREINDIVKYCNTNKPKSK